VNPVKNNLVALGSAAVLAVYAAGYQRTKAAADRFAGEDNDRRRAVATTEFTPGPDSAANGVRTASRSATADSSPSTHLEQHPAPAAITTAPGASKVTKPPAHGDPVAAQSSSNAASVAAAKLVDSAPAPTVVAATPAPAAPASSGLQGGNGAQVGDSALQNSQTPRGQWKDGSYTGWGTSRHGDIQATVEVRDGHIVSASITQCLTRYSCSWISHLPGQVVARQSPNVDYVSGATQSTNAFYYAVVEALAKAK
jgi:uncharacterized protein with FMN-binding domain